MPARAFPFDSPRYGTYGNALEIMKTRLGNQAETRFLLNLPWGQFCWYYVSREYQEDVYDRKASGRRGADSNRRIKVLQTSPLPLGYRAVRKTLTPFGAPGNYGAGDGI